MRESKAFQMAPEVAARAVDEAEFDMLLKRAGGVHGPVQREDVMPQEQRLWAAPDGAVCMVKVRADAPHFEVLIVRGGTVLARRRFYAQASAFMLAESWRPDVVPRRPQDESDGTARAWARSERDAMMGGRYEPDVASAFGSRSAPRPLKAVGGVETPRPHRPF